MIIEIIVSIIFLYVFLWFFMSRLVVPYLGFWKSRIPGKIPDEMQKTINDLKKNKNKEKYLKAAFMVVVKKYEGKRFYAYWHFNKLFQRSLKKIWHKEGFQPCTIQNHVLRVLLVKGGLFSDKDIKFRHRFFEFSIHQDILVRVSKDKWIALDPWGYGVGTPFGRVRDYTFHSKPNEKLYDGVYRKKPL